MRQCYNILSNYDIFLIYPSKIDISRYYDFIPSLKSLPVNDCWMSSLKSYNKMMMSGCIFSTLTGYSHVLIHEPDAIVLRDDLREWCKKPYDYIGAPWFAGYDKATINSSLLSGGNFGLSLHNLSSVQRVLNSSLRWYPYSAILGDFFSFAYGDFKRAKRGTKAMFDGGLLRGAHKIYYKNCDRFWSELVPLIDKGFRVAPVDEALRFSWEVLPRRCMELNGGQLPFGLHKWYKYDFDFVCEILENANVDISLIKHAIEK